MNPHRNLGIVCAFLSCGFALGGCDDDDGLSLNEVKKFDTYSVYYAGSKVAGLPLEEIVGYPSGDESCCTFIYGRCTPSSGTEGSCEPPLEIQIFSICERGVSAPNRRRDLYDFRGAKAVGGRGSLGGSAMEVFTGRTTVVIWADRRNVFKAAARQLRDVRATQPQALLPPPVQGLLWGNCHVEAKLGGRPSRTPRERPRLDSNQRPSA